MQRAKLQVASNQANEGKFIRPKLIEGCITAMINSAFLEPEIDAYNGARGPMAGVELKHLHHIHHCPYSNNIIFSSFIQPQSIIIK